MSFKRTIEELKGGKVEFITIQTNDENSLTRDNMLELKDIMAELKDNSQIRAVIFTSEHAKFFCNGLDASNIMNTAKDKLAEEAGEIIYLFAELLQFDKPLLTEVTGYAMGGGAVLTVASDFRFMIQGKARIAFTEVLVGLPLPGSFTEKIKQYVHPSKVNEVCLLGSNYKAEQAQAIGLIDEIAADLTSLRKLVTKKLEAILKIPSSAYADTKRNLNRDIIEKLDYFSEKAMDSFNNPLISSNMIEAMTALNEKRRPNFK